MASILFKGLPVFFPPLDDFDQRISQITGELERLKQKKTAAEDGDIDSQIEDLNAQLAEVQSARAECSQSFFVKPPAPPPDARKAGIGPALLGSIWVCLGCAIFFLPLGVGTAIFLEEFKPRNKFLLFISGLLQLNISNLAGVPSIVYGILGLTAFATMFGVMGSPHDPKLEVGSTFYRQYLTEGMEVVLIPTESRDDVPVLTNGMRAETSNGQEITLNIIGEDDEYPDDEKIVKQSLFHDAEGGSLTKNAWYSFRLPFGRTVLAASLTLMLVILPVVIIATQEALRAVPSSLRQAALGLGCTSWQVVRNVTLPSALPGIMTGSILAMSRAIGEAAPILMISGIVYITTGPKHLVDDFSILPLQIFYWAGLPIDPNDPLNFQHAAAGGIIVLLLVLFAFNSVAILIRQIAQQRLT